jgi:hypothetical protein
MGHEMFERLLLKVLSKKMFSKDKLIKRILCRSVIYSEIMFLLKISISTPNLMTIMTICWACEKIK